MRSIKTEGAVCAVALHGFGAAMSQAFVVLEADDEPAEAGPAILRRAA
ncbi:MAG: hypothetical protein Q8R82_00710 [Hyphomonadaceae bacterium]|nr:hypothetical protein [Hyphomonadaceae bacterium]